MSGPTAGREVHLDVRDDIRRGQEPLQRIMATVTGIGPQDVLVLRAPFEPVPLYRALGRKGFVHRTERRGEDDWWVWFTRQPGLGGESETPAAAAGVDPMTMSLDVRGLEPPLPMVRILECLERLGPGQRLEVVHDRRPVFLYPQLDERGFLHETREPEPGVVRIVIRPKAGGA
jgi:uncharacterized protein (DUF2249 family)